MKPRWIPGDVISYYVLKEIGDEGVKRIRTLYEIGCSQEAVNEYYRRQPDGLYAFDVMLFICGEDASFKGVNWGGTE